MSSPARKADSHCIESEQRCDGFYGNWLTDSGLALWHFFGALQVYDQKLYSDRLAEYVQA